YPPNPRRHSLTTASSPHAYTSASRPAPSLTPITPAPSRPDSQPLTVGVIPVDVQALVSPAANPASALARGRRSPAVGWSFMPARHRPHPADTRTATAT